jgi:hypothetical protein
VTTESHLVLALPLRRVPTDLRTLLRSTLELLQRQAEALRCISALSARLQVAEKGRNEL